MPSSLAKTLFGEADQYNRILELAGKMNPPVGSAQTVIAALATEFWFKCLLAVAGKDVPHLHDLKTLHDDLPAETRRLIREGWEKNPRAKATADQFRSMGDPIGALDKEIEQGSDGVEIFRYFYEGPPTRTFRLIPLPFVLKSVAMGLSPDLG